MDKKIILTKSQIEKLHIFIDRKIEKIGCDHSRKWTMIWAKKNQINIDDLIDALDDNGGFCDCEVVLNILEEIDLILEEKPKIIDDENPYKIPINHKVIENRIYTKAVFAVKDPKDKCYANDGEILFPSPKDFKPKKRMRKMFHFFNGMESELPSDWGRVKSIEPIMAKDFAKKLRATKLESLEKIGEREADFYLSQVDKYDLDRIVSAELVNRLRGYKMHIELKIS